MYIKILCSSLLLSCCICFCSKVNAQQLNVSEVELPLTKKGAKFGRFAGAYWDTNGEQLHTFYAYSEKRRSPQQLDVVSFDAKSGKVDEARTIPYALDELSQYNLEINEEEADPESFSNFDQPVYWFKADFIGLDLVAFKGDFTPQYDLGNFLGYTYKKQGKKIVLLEDNQQLIGSFVRPFGPMVEKYSSKVIDRSIAGIKSALTFGYVPAGDKVLLGGVINGKVKIGQAASEDWNRFRIMTGIYDPQAQQWESQQVYETDYTLWPLHSKVAPDGSTYAIYAAYKKGKLAINGMRAIPKGAQGLLAMRFDESGNKLSETLIASDRGFGARFSSDGTSGARIVDEGDEMYAVEFTTFKGATGLHFARIDEKGTSAPQFFSAEQLSSTSLTPGKEKIGKFKNVTGILVDRVLKLPNDERLLIAYAKGIDQYIMIQFENATGALIQSFVVDQVEATNTKISTGARGMARLATGDEGAYPVATCVAEMKDDYLLLFRSQTAEMSPGVKSRTSTYTSKGKYVSTTYTTRKVVTVDEMYAFAKLVRFNPAKRSLSDAEVLTKTLTVGAEPILVNDEGQAFISGFAKKHPTMIIVE